MERLGKQTIKFNTPPTILKPLLLLVLKKDKGPLAKYFDQCLEDEFWGEKLGKKQKVKL